MSNEDDRARIQQLEARMARMEALLNELVAHRAAKPAVSEQRTAPDVVPLEPSPLSHAVAAVTEVRSAHTPAEVPQATVLPLNVPTPLPIAPTLLPTESARVAETQPPLATAEKVPIVVAHIGKKPEAQAQATPPKIAPLEKQKKSGGIEQAIGLKWAGWIGAMVLIISAGMGFVYAYDQGWFDHVPPSLKLILMALFGFGVIGIGEVVFRRINQLASTGLFAAGVSILFIVAFAGNHYYALYTQGTAFWVMGMAVLLGVLISLRGKFVSIAMLSIIGGNLVPIMLRTGQTPGVTLLVYALFLQVLALVPTFFGQSSKWWALRTVSLISTTIWILVVLDANSTAPYTLLFIELLSAALYHAEVIASAVRRVIPEPAPNSNAAKPVSADRAGGVLFCMFVTLILCALGLITLWKETNHIKTTWVVALALFYGWQGMSLSAWLGERLKPHADGFKVQSALLLMLAVPLGLQGFWMTAGWGLLAVGFSALGARVKLPATRVFTAITLTIGLVTWFTYDSYVWNLNPNSAPNLNLYILNSYCGAALGLALSCVAIYIITNRSSEEKPVAVRHMLLHIACIPVAIVAWAGIIELYRFYKIDSSAPTQVLSNDFAELLYLAALSIVVSIVHATARKIGWKIDGHPLRWSAFVLAMIPFGFCILMDYRNWMDPTPATAISVNLYLALSAIIVLALGASSFLFKSDPDKEQVLIAPLTFANVNIRTEYIVAALGLCCAFCVFWTGSWSIARYVDKLAAGISMNATDASLTKQLSLSLFWSIFALALIVIGFVFNRAISRYAGLALFMLTLIKVGIFDLSFLSQGYRILSFAGLGILLLATSVLYGYFSPRLLAKVQAGAGPAPMPGE